MGLAPKDRAPPGYGEGGTKERAVGGTREGPAACPRAGQGVAARRGDPCGRSAYGLDRGNAAEGGEPEARAARGSFSQAKRGRWCSSGRSRSAAPREAS